MTRLIMAVASGFYVGYLPVAPGSFGSLLAVPLYFLFAGHGLPYYLGAIGAILVVGFFAAGSAEKILDMQDPGVVVIDEVAGMLITLIGAPGKPLVLLIGFVLFRVFDILKPFPVNFVDQRLHGGLGIMLDDVLAGIYSLVVLQIICKIWFF